MHSPLTYLRPRSRSTFDLAGTPDSPYSGNDIESGSWIGALVVAALFYLFGWWGIHAGGLEGTNLTLIWPAAGIGVVGVLIFGYRTCLPVFVASAAMNLPPVVPATEASFAVLPTLLYGLGDATEVGLAALLTRRLGGLRSGARGFLARALVAFPVAAVVGAGILITATFAGHPGPQASPFAIWHAVALADYLGMLAIATPLWLWYAYTEPAPVPTRWFELAAYLALAGLSLAMREPFDLYYLLPLISIALMLRMPTRTAAGIVAALSILVLWLTTIGLGPLSRSVPHDTFLTTVAFVASMNIAAYAVGLLWRDLLWYQEHLEATVSERTEALRLANAKLDYLARIDDLTRLWNRRHFEECFHQECERSRRGGHSIGLIELDVDHFKDINDTYGHAVGDQVLQELAECLRTALRDADMVARTGGEEFAMLLVDCDADYGESAAERLRQVVAEKPVKTEKATIPFTISAGVVIFTPSRLTDMTTEEICETARATADRRLYAAKSGGRNQVVGASGAEKI